MSMLGRGDWGLFEDGIQFCQNLLLGFSFWLFSCQFGKESGPGFKAF